MKIIKKAPHILLFCCSFLLLTSCGGTTLAQHHANVYRAMEREDWPGAKIYVENNKKSMYDKQNAKLLYQLDKGYFAQHSGEHQEAAANYEKAVEIIDDLWTKSIRKEIGAATRGEKVKDYAGTDYEKVLAHIYAAINYALAGDLENARVEARAVSDRLQQYNDHAGKKNTYKDDAFARWFSGWLLESEGDEQAFNDAKIDYETAYEIYSASAYSDIYQRTVPAFVTEDLLRAASYAGIEDTIKKIVKKNSKVKYLPANEFKQKGQILFIHQVGMAPEKEETVETTSVAREILRAAVNDMEADGENQNSMRQSGLSGSSFLSGAFGAAVGQATIAYPVLVNKPYSLVGSEIAADGQVAETVLVEDIEALAHKIYAEELPRIKRRAMTRTVIKNIMAGIAAYASKSILIKALNLNTKPTVADFALGYALADRGYYHADIRSWFVLPAKLRAAKLYLDPGTYTLTVNYKNHSGAVVKTKTFADIKVKAGQYIVLSDRTVN